jgi:hypothetical protein
LYLWELRLTLELLLDLCQFLGQLASIRTLTSDGIQHHLVSVVVRYAGKVVRAGVSTYCLRDYNLLYLVLRSIVRWSVRRRVVAVGGSRVVTVRRIVTSTIPIAIGRGAVASSGVSRGANNTRNQQGNWSQARQIEWRSQEEKQNEASHGQFLLTKVRGFINP